MIYAAKMPMHDTPFSPRKDADAAMLMPAVAAIFFFFFLIRHTPYATPYHVGDRERYVFAFTTLRLRCRSVYADDAFAAFS